MTDLPGRPGRPPTGWALALLACSGLFLASLALPWSRGTWAPRERGWSVLLAGDGYPRLGSLLVAAWVLAVVLARNRPARGRSAAGAVVAALVGCAVCPGYYWLAITQDRGWAIGLDAAGRTTEWPISTSPGAGYYLATGSSVVLLVTVLLRVRQARRAGRAPVQQPV